jgi:glycerophosphoryl diester phosphodiesterase
LTFSAFEPETGSTAMLIYGHRGASGNFPENTLHAFVGAMQQGADGVELDVMRCGSGELVVCHDEWLDRLARRHLEVAATPWWKLKTIDVGTHLGFGPAQVPLLETVFAALPRTAQVNVEIKCELLDDGGLAAQVGEFLVQHKLEDRSLVSSFNPISLMRLAHAHPQLRRGFLLDPAKRHVIDSAWIALTANASVHPHFSRVTPARVAFWHALGLQVVVWTVNDVEEAKRQQAMNVDALITNHPGLLRQALR